MFQIVWQLLVINVDTKLYTYRNSTGRHPFHRIKFVNGKTYQIGTHWNRLLEEGLCFIARNFFSPLHLAGANRKVNMCRLLTLPLPPL